jgi:hypothetical protein
MKSNIEIKSGKKIILPSRMFRDNDLEDMQIDSVDNQIFFNKAIYGTDFVVVGAEKDNMGIINYPDCSHITFSEKKLVEVVEKQINHQKGDFVVLPCFKEETEYDVSKKLSIAKLLKKSGKVDNKDIVLEISHKIDDVTMDRVISESDSFDCLAIFYGVHFGWEPSFTSICEKIIFFKIYTGKKVFCTAVPMMFSGGGKGSREAHLLPIWDLICDGWIKNWRPGGERKIIKIVDFVDLKNKDITGWARYHQTGEIIKYVNTSVFNLFQDGKQNERLREQYTKMLLDEILNEISSLTPSNIEAFLIAKCPAIYQTMIARAYCEKIIQKNILEAEWRNLYLAGEMKLLDSHLRETFSPQALERKLKGIPQLISAEKMSIEVLMGEVDKI